MRENLVHFVVCTSTLAQGVNLPLRYLIITNVYQNQERIKVRDFHNLIGRAGRAGMHTEGSILFSDPDIYDKRKVRKENLPWKQVKELLDPNKSESCVSNLLTIFDPIKNENGQRILTLDALDFVKSYIEEKDEVLRYAQEISDKYSGIGFSQSVIEQQMLWKIDLICAVESFLLAHWDEREGGLSDEATINLAESTLAYFLADGQQKENIKTLFKLLAENIASTVTVPARRCAYGRTLYGLQNSIAIETWLMDNFDELATLDNVDDIIELIWPIFSTNIKNNIFNKYDTPDALKKLVKMWLAGEPFYALLEETQTQGAKMIYGRSPRRNFGIEHMVDICEDGLAFDGALFIGAICELIDMLEFENSNALLSRLHIFQKQMKYGLPSELTVMVYELGIADRVIAQELVEKLGIAGNNKKQLIKSIKKHRDKAMEIVGNYPQYFQKRLRDLMADTQ